MKKLFSLGLFITAVLFMTIACNAQVISGKVVKVSDGDTFTLLLDGNKTARIRLNGIDAPEIKGGQPYSRAAREYLSDMIAGQTVAVEVKNTDRYGRYIGVVSTSSVRDVNLEMLRAGLAWHYSYYDKTPSYIKAEREARQSKIGLWRDNKPINPYDWRKKK